MTRILSKAKYDEMMDDLSISSVFEMNKKYGSNWAKEMMDKRLNMTIIDDFYDELTQVHKTEEDLLRDENSKLKNKITELDELIDNNLFAARVDLANHAATIAYLRDIIDDDIQKLAIKRLMGKLEERNAYILRLENEVAVFEEENNDLIDNLEIADFYINILEVEVEIQDEMIDDLVEEAVDADEIIDDFEDYVVELEEEMKGFNLFDEIMELQAKWLNRKE